MAATFNIEMITKRTEFRVRPGDKLALPCELQSTGDDEHRGASQVGVSIHIIRDLFPHQLVDRSTNWSTNSSTGRPKYWVATVVSGIGNNEFESCLRIFSWIFIYLRLAELRGKRAITILTE